MATATVLATGLGALPVVVLGKARARGAQGLLSGFAAGVMAVAATVGLLLPAFDRGDGSTVGWLAAAGALALLLCAALGRRTGDGGAARPARARCSCSACSSSTAFREGFAIGSAFASDVVGLSAFVIAAIAIQDVPEGTATAAAMAPAGYRPRRAGVGGDPARVRRSPARYLAWLAVERSRRLLAPSFALAGGAMLALVAVDLLPDAWRHAPHARVVAGTVAGALLMLAVGAALDV